MFKITVPSLPTESDENFVAPFIPDVIFITSGVFSALGASAHMSLINSLKAKIETANMNATGDPMGNPAVAVFKLVAYQVVTDGSSDNTVLYGIAQNVVAIPTNLVG